MGRAEVVTALTVRVSRDNVRTALAARVTARTALAAAVFGSCGVPGIASTVPAEVDGAVMVNAPVMVASMVLAEVNIAATTPIQQLPRLLPLLLRA